MYIFCTVLKMFINLPIELQENIYQRLDAGDRTKMMLALPKQSTLYNKDREKGLAVASKFFNRNRRKIFDKTKFIKPYLLNYLTKYKNDFMIKQFCDEFGVDALTPFQCDLVTAVKNNSVCVDTQYVWPENQYLILCELYRNGRPDTFTKLYENIYIRDKIINLFLTNMNDFIYNIINYANKDLLRFVLHGEYIFKDQIQGHIQNTLSHLASFDNLSIFLSKFHLELISSYVTIPKVTVWKLIELAEEDFCVSAWEFLNKYLIETYH